MGTEQQDKASALILDSWKSDVKIPALDEGIRPQNRMDGYAIQARVEQLSTQPLIGWKIAATSAAGQAHIGLDGPIAGRLLAERQIRSGEGCSLATNKMRVAEAEFAFKMARDLPPRDTPYLVEEVMEAVGAMHLSIEVPDSRFEDFAAVGADQLIADNACAHDFYLGHECEDWRNVDLSAHAVTGQTQSQNKQGTGANVLGDPRIALTWLVNELSQMGITLKAGEFVMTGTSTDPVPIEPGDEFVADFGLFGRVSVQFS
ncbi:MAG: hydratase [Hyphomicrobiales bacterium]|nr:MAG: hydratase [Hyphomicrobiales bacterium]